MFFKELVEQHRVHRIVSDGVKLTFCIPNHQVRVYFCNFLGNQTELRCPSLVTLVVEGNRLKRQDGFTSVSHHGNVVLESHRRAGRAELTEGVYQDWYGVCVCGCNPTNVADKATVIYIVCTQGADNDDSTCTGHELAGICSQRNVAAATYVVGQRSVADYDVLPPSNVAGKRSTAQGRIITADCVVIKRLPTNGGIFSTGGVAKERFLTAGRVEDAGRIAR